MAAACAWHHGGRPYRRPYFAGAKECGVGAVDLRPADEFLRSLRTFPTFDKGWTRRVNDLRVTTLGMVGEEAEEVATPEQVMKLASAIEPIWRIPIATSPCPARAWRHYPEVRRSPRLSGSVSLRRSTRRAQRPAGAQATLRLPSSPIQPAAPHGPSVAAVLPSGCSGLRSGRFGWRRTGSNSLGPRHRPAWSRFAGIMCSCSRRISVATLGRFTTPIPASDPHPCPVDRGLCDRQSTGRLGMKLIGWVCLFHGGAAVLVLALAMAVGLL
jgi:hypothetical protein